MTREEAIEILAHDWTVIENPNYERDDVINALDIAIEALSQPIVCEDYRIDDDHIFCSPRIADRVVEALSKMDKEGEE